MKAKVLVVVGVGFVASTALPRIVAFAQPTHLQQYVRFEGTATKLHVRVSRDSAELIAVSCAQARTLGSVQNTGFAMRRAFLLQCADVSRTGIQQRIAPRVTLNTQDRTAPRHAPLAEETS